MTFGDHVLAWRRAGGLTQAALAAKTGIAQPNVAALEAGRLEPKLSTIRRLAAAFQITPGTLLDRRPPQSGWNRHRIDALVRGALGPQRSTDLPSTKLVHALRVVASAKLAAAGRPVALRGRTGERLLKQLRSDLGPRLWAAVTQRLDKLV